MYLFPIHLLVSEHSANCVHIMAIMYNTVITQHMYAFSTASFPLYMYSVVRFVFNF